MQHSAYALSELGTGIKDSPLSFVSGTL